MGYFNIAAVGVSASSNSTGGPLKSAHVTNTRSNQKSARLLLHQFLEGLSKEDMSIVKQNIREAALTAFLALQPKLGETKGSFSLFGFDYLVQEDLNVKVLETNCNCELFFNEEAHGVERTTISTNLITGMMDIVLASSLSPISFKNILEKFAVDQRSELQSPKQSFDLDASGVRRSWELLYSEVVDPPYSVVNLKESCTPMP